MGWAMIHTYIGERLIDRVDGREKATGSALYVADIRIPGMLEGSVVRSPHPHARILDVRTEAARQHPGVLGVVTGRTVTQQLWGTTQRDQYALAIDKVRYVGDEVAAVAAVDAETAEEAARLIEVDYEILPAVFDPVLALEADAPQIHDAKPRNTSLELSLARGEVSAAFAAADLVLDDAFETQVQWHASLEPTGSVALVDPSGVLIIWMNASGVFETRNRIARALCRSIDDVRVIQPHVGGSFGGRGHDNNALICALLAIETGRPVRIINRREDDFAATRPRTPMRSWIRIGFKRDGTITGKELKIIADDGAYSAHGPAVSKVAAARHDHMFRYQDLASELRVVHTNNVPTGAMRGFGNECGQWPMQQMLDMGAHALGLDPRDVLLTNVVQTGDVSAHGARISSAAVKECIVEAARLVDWDAKRSSRRPDRGLGIAASVHVSGKRTHHYDGSTAQIVLTPGGRVRLSTGEGDTGSGTKTVLAQIAAEAIGVSLADVEVSQADTSHTHHAFGTHGSRATYIAGNAVRLAGERIRSQLLSVAAEMLRAAPSEISIVLGRAQHIDESGRERSISVAEIAEHALYRRDGHPIAAIETWDPPSEMVDQHLYGNESGAYNFSACAMEVRVDRETGRFEILGVGIATDAGTVIFPIGAEGQTEGALAQGLGYAFTEGLLVTDGRLENPNFSDYRMPCIADMPPLKQVFVESHDPHGPYGAKGMGQVALDTIAPALANAIVDAVNVRIRSLPITAEKVLRGLEEQSAR